MQEATVAVDRISELEKKIESLAAVAAPCARPECQRARALLKTRPPIQYSPQSIEQVRSKEMGLIWLTVVVFSLVWSFWCVHKENYVVGLINFVLGFLVLWRHLYVDTPFYMRTIAMAVVVGTFVLL